MTFERLMASMSHCSRLVVSSAHYSHPMQFPVRTKKNSSINRHSTWRTGINRFTFLACRRKNLSHGSILSLGAGFCCELIWSRKHFPSPKANFNVSNACCALRKEQEEIESMFDWLHTKQALTSSDHCVHDRATTRSNSKYRQWTISAVLVAIDFASFELYA